VQLLKTMTPARILAVDTAAERLEFARSLGADEAVLSKDGEAVAAVQSATGGAGADIVLDFVAEGSTPELGLRMLRRGGTYSIVGYGGTLTNPTVDMIVRELRIVGNFVGSYRDLVELMELNRQGKVRISMKPYPLAEAPRAIEDLRAGRILGRAVLVP
jgi:D-arabinose 1-dehydrogenase-like Zn-dependent alcohol dehydrogenase